MEVVQLPELREKDFGSSEGKKFGARTGGSDANFQSDSETHDSMRTRVDRFIDVHLNPIFDEHMSEDISVVIVSHGIILGVLLKVLLSRHSAKQLNSLHQHGEILAAWSNTGVLQAKIEPTTSTPERSVSREIGLSNPGNTSSKPTRRPVDLSFTVQLTNNVDHLQGLKKTKGGIGSATFDTRQRTMDSFFGPASKKRKLKENKD